ncbi:hypothetical protein B0H19DRAFT_1386086 [Mycena capillaripes]|nr:hypothetical protein B0H19DRAFT_1386086 [Mycena capillaripes]
MPSLIRQLINTATVVPPPPRMSCIIHPQRLNNLNKNRHSQLFPSAAPSPFSAFKSPTLRWEIIRATCRARRNHWMLLADSDLSARECIASSHAMLYASIAWLVYLAVFWLRRERGKGQTPGEG